MHIPFIKKLLPRGRDNKKSVALISLNTGIGNEKDALLAFFNEQQPPIAIVNAIFFAVVVRATQWSEINLALEVLVGSFLDDNMRSAHAFPVGIEVPFATLHGATLPLDLMSLAVVDELARFVNRCFLNVYGPVLQEFNTEVISLLEVGIFSIVDCRKPSRFERCFSNKSMRLFCASNATITHLQEERRCTFPTDLEGKKAAAHRKEGRKKLKFASFVKWASLPILLLPFSLFSIATTNWLACWKTFQNICNEVAHLCKKTG